MRTDTPRTLTSGTLTVPYMPLTRKSIDCFAPILPNDFDHCGLPGGEALWTGGGFYSPGVCFEGYHALCTQTTAASDGWPVRAEETAVRCVPV